MPMKLRTLPSALESRGLLTRVDPQQRRFWYGVRLLEVEKVDKVGLLSEPPMTGVYMETSDNDPTLPINGETDTILRGSDIHPPLPSNGEDVANSEGSNAHPLDEWTEDGAPEYEDYGCPPP